MIGIRFGSSFIQFFRLRWPIDASLPLFISFHFTPLIMRFIHFNLREISDQTSNDRRPSILLHSLSSSAALRQTSNLGSIDQNYCQSPIVNWPNVATSLQIILSLAFILFSFTSSFHLSPPTITNFSIISHKSIY